MANIFEFLSKDGNITPEKVRKSRQMQFRDKTAYVWGLCYRWDPSLSMSPARRLAHFMPLCTDSWFFLSFENQTRSLVVVWIAAQIWRLRKSNTCKLLKNNAWAYTIDILFHQRRWCFSSHNTVSGITHFTPYKAIFCSISSIRQPVKKQDDFPFP